MTDIKRASDGEATLGTEIKKFAKDLPFWKKRIAKDILAGKEITDEAVESYYKEMLRDNKVLPPSPIPKPPIEIEYNEEESDSYDLDLKFKRLEKVQGVNALKENQVLEFSDNLTILYGINGSGKSGYTRLFKQAFYSKVPEEILPNIHSDNPPLTVSAHFTFFGVDGKISTIYPPNAPSQEFDQFAVFDGKGIIKQLVDKNEFEFKPAGLQFFSKLTAIINQLEAKLNLEIESKKNGLDFSVLFSENSIIKEKMQNLSADSDLEELQNLSVYTSKHQEEKDQIEKNYEELLLKSRSKKSELKNLKDLKRLIVLNKEKVSENNIFFSNENIGKIKQFVTNYNRVRNIFHDEGTEKFKTEKIQSIGGEEWQTFIVSALNFAKIQNNAHDYPLESDNCLFCHQELPASSIKLIRDYWEYLKSDAEKNFKDVNKKLDLLLDEFETKDFHLFKSDSILTQWVSKHSPDDLEKLRVQLEKQAKLSKDMKQLISSGFQTDWESEQVDLSFHSKWTITVDKSIKLLEQNEEFEKLEELQKSRVLLEHKKKLNSNIEKVKNSIYERKWIRRSEAINFGKHSITAAEKRISDKFFNQKYIEAFNRECQNLNGNFGIDISYTGAGGRSFRELKLKGKNPNAVLSEGEQKVIALADFIAEMKMSLLNCGIILDDPVSSLDEYRKSIIAGRLVKESKEKQVIIFTHDLVFLSSLIEKANGIKTPFSCHWIENVDGKNPGTIWLNNTPSFESQYKKSGKAQKCYEKALKAEPEEREHHLKNGFAALRTSYEALVVFELFNGVVQRFKERVSVDSLDKVNFTNEIRDEILESFYLCCRFMEGHSHSDKYAYMKPTLDSLKEEKERFDKIRKKVSDLKK